MYSLFKNATQKSRIDLASDAGELQATSLVFDSSAFFALVGLHTGLKPGTPPRKETHLRVEHRLRGAEPTAQPRANRRIHYTSHLATSRPSTEASRAPKAPPPANRPTRSTKRLRFAAASPRGRFTEAASRSNLERSASRSAPSRPDESSGGGTQ